MRTTAALPAAAGLALGLLSGPLAAQDQPASVEERVARLEGENRTLRQDNDELSRRLDLLAEEFEGFSLGQVLSVPAEGVHGLGPAASQVYAGEDGVSIGGYGELLYTDFDAHDDRGLPSGKNNTLDLQRTVFYFGYKFSDRWIFNSEIEVEHASSGASGEVSAEFAYLDYLWMPEVNVRAGLLLIPMGFVNELHEPTTFLSALRPGVETHLLPTTWRENGIGLYGDLGPVSYRSYVVNGFRASRFGERGLRGARQKGSQALAEDFAWVGRADLTAVPGLLVGGSAYFGHAGQELVTPAGAGIGAGVILAEAHAEWKWRGLQLRALAALGRIDDVAALDAALGLGPLDSVGEALHGYYLELGYDLFSVTALDPGAEDMALIPFARWESFDTQSSVPPGFFSDPSTGTDILTVGISFQPMAQAVVKIDYQNVRNGAGTGADQFHVLVGYIF